MNDLWQACASHLESELPEQLYRTWIKPLVFLGYDDDGHVLKLGAPNRVKLDWVKVLAHWPHNCWDPRLG